MLNLDLFNEDNDHDLIQMRTVRITPEIAENFLSKNKSNRKHRKTVVINLTKILKKNDWVYTHQGIAFNKDGILIDGQHRLMAVVQSGVPARMCVFTNVPNEAFGVIDQGEKRSAYDILKTSPPISSVVRLALRVAESSSRPTYQSMLPYFEALKDTIEELLATSPTSGPYFSTAMIRLMACVLILKKPEDKDYIMDVYGKLVRSDYSSLPPVALAWVSQKDRGNVNEKNGNYTDAFCRAHYVFDPENMDSNRIVVTDERKARVSNFMRESLKELVAKYLEEIDEEI